MSTSIPAWLQHATHLNVLHATDKVINLMTAEGRLISLVSQSLGDGPHNIVLPLNRFEQIPSFGREIELEEETLRVAGLEVELNNAELWPPGLDWPRIRTQRETIQGSVTELGRALRMSSPDPGVVLLLEEHGERATSLSGHFAQAMIEPAERLINGLHAMNLESAIQGTRGLAGLGTGLTPAGDDFLSGAMLACWSGYCDQEMLTHLPGLASEAAQRTTRLSAAYLQSAAQGEFSAIWHVLLEAIAAKDTEGLQSALDVIMGIGHNSGAYTLAGFVRLVEKYPRGNLL